MAIHGSHCSHSGNLGAAWSGLGTAAVGLAVVALGAVWLRFAYHDKEEELTPRERHFRPVAKLTEVRRGVGEVTSRYCHCDWRLLRTPFYGLVLSQSLS